MSDMEARVSKLEQIAEETKLVLDKILAQLADMDKRITALDTRIQVIDTKLDSKPDQGWIVNVMGIMLGTVIGTAGVAAGIIALLIR